QLKRRVFKVRIESSDEKSLGDQEDASNHGWNDQDKGISFVQEDAETQESAPVTTAGISISAAEPKKGKGKMVEPEKTMKKKDQVEFDEKVARNLEAQLQAELEEEERLARQKEEEANIALIAEWDDV
nr:hypothetical protein [Tanacetum cinerariifolium]